MSLADVRKAIYSRLTDDAAIIAVAGSRVYPVRLKQGEKRASIVYQRISAVGDMTMQGPVSLAQTRFQIDCWSDSADEATSLANLVKESLNGFQGQIGVGGNSPVDRVRIQGIFFDSEREFYDDSNGMFRVSRDYIVWHDEF